MENYYNPKLGLSSAYKIYKGQHGLTLNQVKDTIQTYEPVQLNKQIGKIEYYPIVGHGPNSYQADLMLLDPDDGYNCILCIINVITRVAYCYALKKKSDVKNDSELVKDTYRGLKDFYKTVPDVEHLQTDAGTEFVNSKVKELFSDIDYYATSVKTAQGKVERFNQTLRRLITIYQSAYKTTKWVKVLPDLVYNYNHRFHRSIGCSPIECNEEFQFAKEMERYDIPNQKVLIFKKGDKVRILLNKDLFDKGRAEWSSKVYRVDKIDGHRIIVDGEPYQYYQLQKIEGVHTKLFDNNEEVDKVGIKKVKKVVRDLNKEGIAKYNKPGLKEQEVVGKRVRVKYDKSLVGRLIDRGNGETGKIVEYDPEGDYKWFVKYDKKAKLKHEWMDAYEVQQFLVN